MEGVAVREDSNLFPVHAAVRLLQTATKQRTERKGYSYYALSRGTNCTHVEKKKGNAARRSP